MRRVFKYFLGIISFALVVTMVIVFFPYISSAVSNILLNGKYERTATILNEEMSKVSDLTAVKYQQEGIMEIKVNALLLGQVASAQAPFSYEIGLGISLSEIELTAGDWGITARVPQAKMIYDSFQVTGEPKMDFSLYKITTKDYQDASDEQAAECRTSYLNHDHFLDEAWEEACNQLQELFNGWAGENVPVTFELLMEEAETPAEGA